MTRAVAPITVAMPIYNGVDYVDRALAAIRAQEFGDFEAVIRDNASTDDTEEIVRDLIRDDPRFRYVRNDANVGGARNSNLLLAEARSPLIVWSYHDDEPDPRFFADSYARLADDPRAVLAFPRVQLIDAESRVVGRHDDADLEIADAEPHRRLSRVLRRLVGQVQYGLMRTDVVREAGGVSTSVAGEMVVPAAMALRGRLLLASPDGPRLSVRQHPHRSGGNRTSEAVWADPDRPHVPFPYSRTMPLLLRTIAAAPLSAAERRSARAVLLRDWTVPGLRSVVGDLLRLPWDAGWIGRDGAGAGSVARTDDAGWAGEPPRVAP